MPTSPNALPARPSLATIGEILERQYGKQPPLALRDPLSLILFENLGYLVDDEKRTQAFQALEKKVGLTPKRILAASLGTLQDICHIGGIHPEIRAKRLHEIATLALEEFGGDLTPILKWPLPKARRALSKFPAIGTPGAEKILMICGAQSVLALESNGLRVLTRVGVAEELRSYSATYSAVQTAIRDEVPAETGTLVALHQLLRVHGQTLCKRNSPRCVECPLGKVCRFKRGRSL